MVTAMLYRSVEAPSRQHKEARGQNGQVKTTVLGRTRGSESCTWRSAQNYVVLSRVFMYEERILRSTSDQVQVKSGVSYRLTFGPTKSSSRLAIWVSSTCTCTWKKWQSKAHDSTKFACFLTHFCQERVRCQTQPFPCPRICDPLVASLPSTLGIAICSSPHPASVPAHSRVLASACPLHLAASQQDHFTVVNQRPDTTADVFKMATVIDISGGEPSVATQHDQGYDDDTPLFTCLSCSIAFPNPDDQRTHYRSDLHRYNMKRRVANLPPVKADVFNAKILERRAALAQEAQTAVTPDKCDACDKKFASQNAYRAHLNAKKHKENVARLEKNKSTVSQAGPSSAAATSEAKDEQVPLVFRVPKPIFDSTSTPTSEAAAPTMPSTEAAIVAAEKKQNARDTLMISEDATEEQIQAAIDAKVASSRRIDPSHECIFCAKSGFTQLAETLAHMSKAHGFFIPDTEYLVDLPGLRTR